MGKIVLLDDLTINQIAAGEVIERPASAVKELVENSIDAGAKNITIDIKNGGISYIRVIDDGSGILPDDMEIAFERHATSKIRKASDLDTVKSMGFRGEALASIAAIAKVELVSRTANNKMGYKVVVEGGDIIDKHEEGASKGTSITVKELFYNTPVRYKFLRKDFTELGYIEDTVTRIALANPGVAIKLINSGKTIIQTSGSGKIEDAIYAIYGKEIVENILPVDYEYEDMHVTGVIGKPIISRSNRTNQLFFVNNRYIKDKTLTSAAEQGFKGLVTVGKHGFLILNIEMDMKKVDVNVHPTKLEVRFQEESKVFKAVYHAIKETLLKGDLVSDPDKDYSDLTPNDILKEIKNKDRVEAWGLNKTFESSRNELETKKEDKSENKTKSLGFNDFKNTIEGLDEETRTKFVQEIAKATTSEEISKSLSNFTEFMMEKKKSEIKPEEKEESKTDAEDKTDKLELEDKENELKDKENRLENKDKENELEDKEDKLENKDKENELEDKENKAEHEEKEDLTDKEEKSDILEKEENKSDIEHKEENKSDSEEKGESRFSFGHKEGSKFGFGHKEGSKFSFGHKDETKFDSEYEKEENDNAEKILKDDSEMKDLESEENTAETDENKMMDDSKLDEIIKEEISDLEKKLEENDKKNQKDEEAEKKDEEKLEEKLDEKLDEKDGEDLKAKEDDEEKIAGKEESSKVEDSENKEDENASEEKKDVKEEAVEEKVEEDTPKEDTPKEEMSFEEMYKKLFGRNIEDAKKQYKEKLAEEEEKYPISPIKDNEISIFEQDEETNKMPYKFIGIAFNTYIILSINNDLYILDQHAAHERIMYEKVKKNYYTDVDKDSQLMLLPDIINLNNKEMGIFKDNKELFEKAGFMVEEFGDNTIKLTGVPEFCMDLDTKEIFLETLDEINTVARTAKQELEDKFLATIACKAAVKAHMILTKEEVDNLMEELLKLPNPFSCPHGRPTVIKMSKTDIEKKFSRR